MLRRFPRRNRLATGCVSPCLPVFQWLLFFFPLAGTAGDPVFGGGAYWSCTHGVDGQYGIELSVSAGGAVLGAGWTAVATGYSVRCVRAREGQAIPCFFPLAGSAVAPADVSCTYWSGTATYPASGYTFTVTPDRAASGSYSSAADGYSVRCVRAREEQAIPCFFPLAGSAGVPSDVSGIYWTVSVAYPGACYTFTVTSDRAGANDFTTPESGLSLRCVRAREEQAVPLFWIVWF